MGVFQQIDVSSHAKSFSDKPCNVISDFRIFQIAKLTSMDALIVELRQAVYIGAIAMGPINGSD